MSTADIKEVADKMKNVHRDMVLWENNLAAIQTKVNDLIRQKELLQKEIDVKSVAFTSSMSEERMRLERDKAFLSEERQKLDAGKKELLAKLEEVRIERQASEKAKAEAIGNLDKAKYLRANVDQFIIAVQRALAVLG